ncbi:BIRC7_8 [Mytilus coruscus]|uniref:BIRC7_8 n=1 Tax=Mytilus coruscus TaxID=42192 RepID=A0A6J8B723_MYTCO|nr:BIRC7_8 [Mytilus coruscus]
MTHRQQLVIILFLGNVFFCIAEIKWIVEKKVNNYGQNLKLFCKADNCCSANMTKRWFGGPQQTPLWLSSSKDSAEKSENAKYMFTIEKNGFGLVIKNITVEDINVTYKCSYNFEEASDMLYSSDAFSDKQENSEKNTIGQNSVENSSNYIPVIVPCVVVLFLLTCISIIVVWKYAKLNSLLFLCKQRRKKRKAGDDVENAQELENLTSEDKEKAQQSSENSLQENGIEANEINKGTTTDLTEEVIVEQTEALRKQKPKYPTFSSEELRIKSFTGVSHELSPRIFAKAGFFSYGRDNFVRCFHCGGALKDWKSGDDPLNEHAKWFPQCSFVKDNYIGKVQTPHQDGAHV